MVAVKQLSLGLCLVSSAACWNAAASMLPIQSPQMVVDDLLAADRRFGVASAKTTLVPGLTAMFADDVIMQGPTGLVHGLEAARTALNGNPVNATATLTWAPVRGGVSADGTHGFTYGYMTMTPAGGAPLPLKYLAYWIRRDGAWKVAAYKRRGRPAGEVKTTLMPASLPDRLVMSPDMSQLMTHTRSLVAAEKAFSDEAQQIGLGPAFEKHGWPDAMNMGGPTDAGFVVGNVEVGRSVGGGAPAGGSSVYWSADEALVSPVGDLGVTFGKITPHPVAGGPAPASVPFFTVWRRINGVWKYIAE